MKGSVRGQSEGLFTVVDSIGRSKYEDKLAFKERMQKARAALIAEFGENEGKKRAKEAGIAATTAEFAKIHGIYSHNTADCYRGIWREVIAYAREYAITNRNEGYRHLEDTRLKDITKIMTPEIAVSFVLSKLESTEKEKTVKNYRSAISKMGLAIDKWLQKFDEPMGEFKSRAHAYYDAVTEVIKDISLESGSKDRAYDDTTILEKELKAPEHKLSLRLILDQGYRASEVSLIRETQLTGDKMHVTCKNGQEFDRQLSADVAAELNVWIKEHGEFRINQDGFRLDLKQAAEATGQDYNGIHGLRYNFAQNLFLRCINEGMEEDEAFKIVSERLGHHRISITKHYLRR
jgi:integrase